MDTTDITPSNRDESLGKASIESNEADIPDNPLLDCCIQTIKLHAAFNPMMVCPDCKRMIKCFKEEKAFRNYLTFCNSRHRKVFTASLDGLMIVVFRSYGNYT